MEDVSNFIVGHDTLGVFSTGYMSLTIMSPSIVTVVAPLLAIM